MGEVYNGNHGHFHIEAYAKADLAGSIIDRRSTLRYCTFIGGSLVTWRSQKQIVVARSSAKVGFRADADGDCELLWLKKLVKGLKIPSSTPMKLYCDSKAFINIAHNLVQHGRTNHVEVDCHFTKENLERGLTCMPYLSTEE